MWVVAMFNLSTDKPYGMTRVFFGSKRTRKQPEIMAQVKMF